MSFQRSCRRFLRSIYGIGACLAFCVAMQSVQADENRRPSRNRFACDVILEQGMFSVRYRNDAGEGIPDATAILRYCGRPVVILATDAQGEVLFRHLSPGLYELKIENQTEFVRVWTQESAPPKAWKKLELVQNGPILGASGPYAALKLMGPGGNPLPLTMKPEKFIDSCRIADIRILPPVQTAAEEVQVVY